MRHIQTLQQKVHNTQKSLAENEALVRLGIMILAQGGKYILRQG
jgi:hypothetical protein